ncbi:MULTISPECIES: hypothetical protein [Aliivibrio]|uniref:Uncharacterized protein n=1 Tax=Aliivibrio fischeri SR5 TaxID=1088719 RepID=A0AAV3EM21_ALIFS|nr:hypothetical protein [Aliivibrio fischeri]EHN68012.1 hypothetical protein VFSR5_2737 [Aliivibrio fischeri SR5]
MNATMEKSDINVQLGTINNVIDLNIIKSIFNKNISNEKIGSISLWGVVTANDSTGLIIDNLQQGDQLTIESASGLASFKETDMKIIKSVISVYGAISTLGANIITEGQLTPYLSQFNSIFDSIKAAVPDKIQHAVRDASGRDPGTGDYAKNEGGLIVCMPKARGAIYATSDNHLESGAKHNGRQEKYFPKSIKDKESFFFYDKAENKKITSMTGAVNILAFDSKFSDNAGYYEFKVTIKLA